MINLKLVCNDLASDKIKQALNRMLVMGNMINHLYRQIEVLDSAEFGEDWLD